MTIDNHKEIIEKYLFEVMKLPFVCPNGVISYEKTYYENVNKYLIDSGQLLLESADTNYRRRQAINYFTDVMTGGTFEIPFYNTSGLGSETFDNLRFFIVNKDYQALESILFSQVQPADFLQQGRFCICRTIFGYKPGIEIDKRMKEVLTNAQLICSGMTNCLLNKFEHDYYDIVKDFEYFLMTQ